MDLVAKDLLKEKGRKNRRRRSKGKRKLKLRGSGDNLLTVRIHGRAVPLARAVAALEAIIEEVRFK